MKLFLLVGILVLSTSAICAQKRIIEAPYYESPAQSFAITVGVNVIDNGGNSLPFNAEAMSFKTPFFISAEHRFKSNLSAALTVSTNRLTIGAEEKFYASIDATGQFYFDEYLFNTEKIDLYAGVGFGRFFLENNGNNTINVTGGGRYWISDHYGLSLQGFGKVGLSPVNDAVKNHFQYNFGLVWRN